MISLKIYENIIKLTQFEQKQNRCLVSKIVLNNSRRKNEFSVREDTVRVPRRSEQNEHYQRRTSGSLCYSPPMSISKHHGCCVPNTDGSAVFNLGKAQATTITKKWPPILNNIKKLVFDIDILTKSEEPF